MTPNNTGNESHCNTNVSCSVTQDAFRDAKAKFLLNFKSTMEIDLLNSPCTMEDVISAVSTALAAYESQGTHKKFKKSLRSFASRVQLYGNVLDVLVQHHPGYVSLVWGAMKFFFTVDLS